MIEKRVADVSPEHFAWLVEARSANQEATLELYEVIYRSEVLLNADVEIQAAAQDLVSIAFSLWRAVFLSDTSGDIEDQQADIRKFLAKLISDNAVLYATDKNSRNWSFRYYLDNAVFRLERLSKERLGLVDPPDLAQPAESDKAAWRQAQRELQKAIERFKQIVSEASLENDT